MAEPKACPILKSQANKVFELVARAGLDPTEFRWCTVTSAALASGVSRLEHGPTGYFFQFDYYWSDYSKKLMKSSIFSPSYDSSLVTESEDAVWSSQLKNVENWVGYVAREVLAPDLWTELQKERQFADVAGDADTENRPFTVQEQARIGQGLRELKEYLSKTISPTADQLSSIEARLEYLKEASTRLGRKDWIIIALGVITSLIMNFHLGGLAGELFRLAGNLFGWVSRLQASLP